MTPVKGGVCWPKAWCPQPWKLLRPLEGGKGPYIKDRFNVTQYSYVSMPTAWARVSSHTPSWWHGSWCKHSTYAHESPESRDPALTLHVDSGMAALPSCTIACIQQKRPFLFPGYLDQKERADTQIKAMDPLFKNLSLFCWQFSLQLG